MKSFGVKTFEDFTWKHMLDFYSCADCGRCSDQCPANAAGGHCRRGSSRSRRETTAFRHFPVLGTSSNGAPLIGSIYSEDEIWSCTTCGACEAECPLLVEYIDKIVDLRRGMVDDGKVPQSLQKPLKALESRGNPYGKMEKKRADWAKAKEFARRASEILNGKHAPRRLYFVDSITSYDDRMQAIGRATARILDPGRRGLRHPGRGGEGQRPRSAAVWRRDAVPGAARSQHRGHPGVRGAGGSLPPIRMLTTR